MTITTLTNRTLQQPRNTFTSSASLAGRLMDPQSECGYQPMLQGHEVIAPPQGQGTCRRWQGEGYGVPSSPQRILCRALTNFDKRLFLKFLFNHRFYGFRMFCFGNVTKIFLLLLCYVMRIRLWAYVGDLRYFFGFSPRRFNFNSIF